MTRLASASEVAPSAAGIVARLLGFVVTVGLLDRFVDWKQVFAQAVNVPAAVLAVCVIFALVRVWITSVRWRLLNPDSGSEISSWTYFRYMMISTTFNLFLPGALGGDVARSLIIYKTKSPKRFNWILSIAADRYVGLVSILVLGMAATFLLPQVSGRGEYLAVTASLLAATIGGAWALTSELLPVVVRGLLREESGIRRRILELHLRVRRAANLYRAELGRVAAAGGLCLPIHMITFGILYAFALCDGIQVSFLILAAVSSIIWVISAIPVSISGLGLRELSFVYLLSMQGVSADAATALSLQHFAVNVIIGTLGIPLVWFSPAHRPRQE